MRVKPYKRGHSPAAHLLLDQAAYYRMAQRYGFETLEVWHKVTQESAGLVIAPGCEPARTPEADYLQGVILAAAGFAPLPVSDR